MNFALFSANATKVELCLFDSAGKTEIERIVLAEFTDEVWHGYLPDARPGTIYGYRIYGPYEPDAGQRFTRTSCCSIRMPRHCRDTGNGTRPCSATRWKMPTT